MIRMGGDFVVEKYLRQSPLAHLLPHLPETAVGDQLDRMIGLCERPYLSMTALRGQSSDSAFTGAIEKMLKISLPEKPCSSTGDADGLHALWLGPDEWLIVAPANRTNQVDELTMACADLHATAVDVGESRTTLRLSGRAAPELLAKGCSIDLHPRKFTTGRVVATLLAQAHVIIHQIADMPLNGATYDLYVHRSFAEYVWIWLQDAAREYTV